MSRKMPYKWRDLRLIDSELKGYDLVFTVALSQSFARKPAYWIDIYRSKCEHATTNETCFWQLTRQWSYLVTPQHALIENHAISRASNSIKTLFMTFDGMFKNKVGAQWNVSKVTQYLTETECTAEEVKLFQDIMRSIKSVSENSSICMATDEYKISTKIKKMKELQLIRRTKAEW